MAETKQLKHIHEQAMTLMQEGEVARAMGEAERSIKLFEESFKLEKEAAMLLVGDFQNEPTRSVLFRSAASLAISIGDYKEARYMIQFGLIGNPPDDIATELISLGAESSFPYTQMLQNFSYDVAAEEPELLNELEKGKLLSESKKEYQPYIGKIIENSGSISQEKIRSKMRTLYKDRDHRNRKSVLFISSFVAITFTLGIALFIFTSLPAFLFILALIVGVMAISSSYQYHIMPPGYQRYQPYQHFHPMMQANYDYDRDYYRYLRESENQRLVATLIFIVVLIVVFALMGYNF